jgi:hypothetical protein
MKAIVRPWTSSDGSEHGRLLYLWCPGCDALHGVELDKEPTRWGWNGSLEEPTITPSILTHMNGRDSPDKCHCYVTGGKWVFLSDSFHALKGQTVDLVDLPDWVIE